MASTKQDWGHGLHPRKRLGPSNRRSDLKQDKGRSFSTLSRRLLTLPSESRQRPWLNAILLCLPVSSAHYVANQSCIAVVAVVKKIPGNW
jgi:hypothetical protein